MALTFNLETLEHHVRGIDRFDVQRAAFGTNIGEMMAVKSIAAPAQKRRLNFIQLQLGVPDERPVVFYDVEAKPDVIGAVAGEGVEADFNPLHLARFLSGGLLFNSVHNSSD